MLPVSLVRGRLFFWVTTLPLWIKFQADPVQKNPGSLDFAKSRPGNPGIKNSWSRWSLIVTLWTLFVRFSATNKILSTYCLKDQLTWTHLGKGWAQQNPPREAQEELRNSFPIGLTYMVCHKYLALSMRRSKYKVAQRTNCCCDDSDHI